MAKQGTKKNVKLKFDTQWQYSAAPESPDHIILADKYDLFINGKFTSPQ